MTGIDLREYPIDHPNLTTHGEEATDGRPVTGLQVPGEPDLEPTSTRMVGILDAREVDTVYLTTDLGTIPDPAVPATGGWEMHETGPVTVTIGRVPWQRDTTPSDQDYVSTTCEPWVYKVTR